MILSATAIGANVMYAFPRMSAGQVTHSYPNSFALVGIIAYAGWLLIVHRSALSGGTRGVLGLLCVLALALPIAYPLINLYVRPIDVLGSYLLAASCLALGVYVAQRAGVELFERDGAARPGESGT